MDIEYNCIPLILKQYSFNSKMSMCQLNSRKIMKYTYIDILQDRGKTIAFPWELEIFAMFSIMEYEYNNNNFEGKRKNVFNQIITAIRNYTHPKLKDIPPGTRFIEMFILATGLIQFKPQEDMRYRLFRFNYIFNYKNNKIDMPKVFKEKFDLTFDDFLFCFNLFYLLSGNISVEAYDYIVNTNIKAIQLLKLKRSEFIQKQQGKLPDGIDSAYYALKYLNPYPFIDYNSYIYLPLPHLLIDSITDSLLNRLTDNDDTLRSNLGKEVLESYLFLILKESNAYDEIIREFQYKIEKNEYSTPDVMVRTSDKCILFDSKSSVPSVNLRCFNDITIKKQTDKCAGYISQLFKRIKEFGINYYPFETKMEFKKENIFGVVVLLEENYIFKNNIYNQAAELLNINKNSLDYSYMLSNIKIIGLRDIEEASFISKSYVDGLLEQRDDPNKWYDLTLNYFNINKKDNIIRINELNKFINKLSKNLELTLIELYKKGFLKKDI